MSRAQVAGVLPAMLPRIGLAQPGAEALHQAHCASCHADSRLEGTGPALIPETLGRIHGPKLEAPISEGRPATQKESFADRLAPDAIAAISACLETPLATVPERALLGMPRLGTGITWDWQSTTVMATPHLKDITICFINMKTWTTIKVIAIDRRGFFVRRHPNSRYVWTDVFFGPNKDAMHITDNETLKIVQTLHPEPGTTVAHTEVTKDGSRAPVWIWEEDGVGESSMMQSVCRNCSGHR